MQLTNEPTDTPLEDEHDEPTPMSSPLLTKLSQAVPKTAATPAVRVYLIRHGQTNWNKKHKIQGGGYDVPLNKTGKEQARKSAKALEGIEFDAVASSSLARAKETADIVFEHISSSQTNAKPPLRIVDAGYNEMRFGKFEGFGYHRDKKKQALADDGAPKTDGELKLARFLHHKGIVATDREYCFPSRDSIDEYEQTHPLDWSIDPADEVFQMENAGIGESTRIVEDRSIGALSETIARILAERAKSGANDANETKNVAIVSHGRTNKILIGGMINQGCNTIKQGNCNISVLDHSGLDANANENGEEVSWKGGWTARILNFTDHVDSE